MYEDDYLQPTIVDKEINSYGFAEGRNEVSINWFSLAKFQSRGMISDPRNLCMKAKNLPI